MQAIKRFCNKHYYALCFYVFMLIYYFGFAGSVNQWQAGDVTLAFHAVDFSVGFCSKLLPGVIYNLFFDNVTTFKVTLYASVWIIVFYLIIAFLLEKVFLSLKKEYRKVGLLLIFFFIVGPGSLANYTAQFGILDAYWVFAATLFFVFISNKKLYFLAIPMALIVIMVHYAGLLCYAPMMAILLLYKASTVSDRKEKNILLAVFSVTAVSAIALGLYFSVFEVSNVQYTQAELEQILLNRGVKEHNLEFYSYAFFRDTEGEAEVVVQGNVIEKLVALVGQQLYVTFVLLSEGFKDNFYGLEALYVLIVLSPIFVFIINFIMQLIKKNKDNKIKAFSLLCMITLPFLTWVGGLFFSTDLNRWIVNAFIPLMASFLFVLFTEGNEAWKYVKNKIEAIPVSVIATYGIFYLVSVFDPYNG